MKYMKPFRMLSIISVVIVLFSALPLKSQKETGIKMDLNLLSEQFLEKIKKGENTQEIQDKLANISFETLQRSLGTDEEKLAFWVNFYNAYIFVILSDNPKLYDDKKSFFKKEQISIAGKMISFEKIEHGIIRKSQWSLGLGMVRKWFPDTFERKLRVDKRDYRIHFALNCGAKDCPPVAIYRADKVDLQFEEGTKRYLKHTTEYDAQRNEVAVTALFNWFRGDFGCKRGIKTILKKHGLIPDTKSVDLTYKNYDWSLDLDNWIAL